MAWTLVPCLVKLRAEFNEIAPDRDKASDGSIGDTAHAGGGTSDHLPDEDFSALRDKDSDATNEVHAIDVDTGLNVPGLSMESVVQFLLSRCRSGAENRLRYIIYNRRIWSASSSWRQQRYTGPNPHDKHAHFSASYASAREASTASWHLEDLVALTADDRTDIRTIVREELSSYSGRDPIASIYARTGYLANQFAGAALGQLANVSAQLTGIAGADPVDEQSIIAGVLAGLSPQALGQAFMAAGFTPEALAAAIPAEMATSVADVLHARLAS